MCVIVSLCLVTLLGGDDNGGDGGGVKEEMVFFRGLLNKSPYVYISRVYSLLFTLIYTWFYVFPSSSCLSPFLIRGSDTGSSR